MSNNPYDQALQFILDLGISPPAKLLWLLLDDEGPIKISIPTLATRISVSQPTIQRCLGELARRDLILVTRTHTSGVEHTYEATRLRRKE